MKTKMIKVAFVAAMTMMCGVYTSCISKSGKTTETENPSGSVNVNFVDSVLLGSSFLEECRLLNLSSDNEESLIVEVNSLLVGDDRYFVMDRRGNHLVAFDGQGNFIASTDRLEGEGPQSYIRMMDATIDNEQKKVYAHCDSPYCIMVFDMDLNLLEKVSLDYYMTELGSDEKYLYGIRMRDASNFGHELVALDKSNLSAAPVVLLECTKGVYGYGTMGKRMTSCSQGIFVCLPYDNVIYRVKNKELAESYPLDLGDMGVDFSNVGDMSANDFFKSSLRDKIWMFRDIYASDSFLMFACNDVWHFLLNRKTGECSAYFGFHNDMMPYSNTMGFPVQGIDRTFANLWPSEYVMSHKRRLKEKGTVDSDIYKAIENYSREDNPPIILCEMK